jgi:hypothetical protein
MAFQPPAWPSAVDRGQRDGVLVGGEDIAHLKTVCAACELEGPARELQRLRCALSVPGRGTPPGKWQRMSCAKYWRCSQSRSPRERAAKASRTKSSIGSATSIPAYRWDRTIIVDA